MGKQWLLYKVAGSDGSFATGKSSSTTKKPTGKPRKRHTSSSSSSSSSFGGCMSAIFHMFDIQNHHLPFHQPSFISESPVKIPEEPNIILKGVEAPRNSLDMEEEEPIVEQVASSSSTSSLKLKQETNFNIPRMRDIQINTKRSRLMEDVSSECSSSPSTKTPTLVARLMGLDLLPENASPRGSLSSPRVSSSSSHATPLNPLSKLSSHKYNARSLPATPRVSSAPRLSTEEEYHHRFSLQINKENKRRYDENASEYAKQIAKQVRENISRRVGADITNTVKKKEHRRDEFLVVLKPNRPSPSSTANTIAKPRNLDEEVFGHEKENFEPTSLSCAARIRLWEIKNNLNKANSNSLKGSPLSSTSEAIKTPSPSTTTRSPQLMKEEVQVVKQEKPMKIQKCKKLTSEKYDLRLKKMHQQEEPFVKKCNKKSTPLSNHLVKVNTTTKFISFKKDMASPSSQTTLPQKQVPLASITQLPSCQSLSYNTKKTHNLSTQYQVSTNGNTTTSTTTTTTTTTTGSLVFDYFDYISTILSHTGILKTTPISISHWYSPSHPLHPSIFQQLEKRHRTSATGSADRKLIFEVVDELLQRIVKCWKILMS
ncbi:probable serine/threonine-protein kinase dyrk2 isoform X3 [Helianthus annuus]|uniref:probable serine/threonine-protein kinase dyrk2 isoform X3 n=1 Tax=Helianthus annuus TaxID=4232 RepID=UPI001652F959|nr:probable serine/threonine-protein kinase dyrk2 isoform X3 [Helianthus annuus]